MLPIKALTSVKPKPIAKMSDGQLKWLIGRHYDTAVENANRIRARAWKSGYGRKTAFKSEVR